MVDKKEIEKLSNTMFGLTIAYGLSPQKIVDATGVGFNAIGGMQTANPFVNHNDFIKVKGYVDEYYRNRR